jgi:hypothetical protein
MSETTAKQPPISRSDDLDASRHSRKRTKLDALETGPCLPSLKLRGLPEDAELVLSAYHRYKAVHLTGFPLKKASDLTWRTLQSLFDSMGDEDKESWSVEQGSSTTAPADFLDPSCTARGYCSFLLHEKKQDTLTRLPIEELPWFSWAYGPAVWFFFGRNQDSETPFQGRQEHTDAVSHDGTWHYQLSGCKRWFLRPTDELRREFAEQNVDWDTTGSVPVLCEEGDIVVVNTRLWWHQTEIPQQDVPSLSYARDFHFSSDDLDDQEPMCNVDGVYAANDIEPGTIIFREDDMPECSLHRSKDPNCSVVELENGTSAVVSSRKIALGEFFSVPESGDEEESSFDEDEEEDEESEDADEEEGDHADS